MNKKRVWIGVVILAVVLIIIAVIVTLVLVLRKKHKPEETSSQSLDDILSDGSIFPNGSYQIAVDSLKSGNLTKAPLLVDIAMLNSFGLRVDNSSLIAEEGRLSYFFVRLPYVGDDGAVGVRFGDSKSINVIPLNLSIDSSSGVALLGRLPDNTLVYKLEIRIADAMCSNSADGTCSSVSWTPYYIESDISGSPANFNNDLPVACGSQCDTDASSPCAVSCTQCDGQQVAGSDTPVSRRYRMSSTSAQGLKFIYDTYHIKDVVRVSYDGKNIFDSDCVGTEGNKMIMLNYNGKSMELRVDVEPNCEHTTGTVWDFTLPCAPTPTLGFDLAFQIIKPSDFECMAKNGYEFFIGHISFSSNGSVNPTGVSNVRTALQSGFWADAYIYPCIKCDAQTQVKLAISALMSAVPNFHGIVWLDVEVNPRAPWPKDIPTNLQTIASFASALDTYYPNWGIYTRKGNWNTITGNVLTYSHKPLWAINSASTDSLTFAGWTSSLMSQWDLSGSKECGMGIDKDYFYGH
ncbi:unnamed protein product, partial [Mesorhabditis belari]|uniref:Uncharacterized protein n=1 Tax=Mesorhabditis belari TaxID=2138241 RepID=A0AAF3EQW8_9BILA